MSYFTRANITAEIPSKFITEALDDDGDGLEDPGLWEEVVAAAERKVNSRLGQRFTVPFTGKIPVLVTEAAIIFCCAGLYKRRGYNTSETNPWKDAASGMKSKLNAIGNGKQPLTPTTQEAKPSVSVISEPARTSSKQGYIST